MNMKELFGIREMLCEELSEFSGQRELSAAELDAIHKLASSIKNIDKIAMFESGDYSRERVERALISLGRQELENMIRQQGGCQLSCQFCDTVYDFSKEELEQLLASLQEKK